MIDLAHDDGGREADRNGHGYHAEADDDGIDQALHHGAVIPELDEPLQREGLEGPGLRVVGRIERGDAHHQQRAKEIEEEEEDVETDHRLHDELRIHFMVSPSETLKSRSMSMTKAMQAASRMKA